MKKPNEEGLTNDKNQSDKEENSNDTKANNSSKYVNEKGIADVECIRFSGEKTPVVKDKRSIGDDMSDYIFVQPRHHSHSSSGHSSHHHHSSRRHSHHRRHRSRGGRKKKIFNWKKALIITVSSLLALILIVVGSVFLLINKGKGELYEDEIHIMQPDNIETQIQDDGQYIVYNGETYKYNSNITSMLFMGVDKREMEEVDVSGTGGQADVIVLMAIDTQKDKMTMVSIPRDTVTDVAVYSIGGMYIGMEKEQLCLAYAYGDGKEKSCQNVLSSVQRMFYNVPIKSYFALDLDGVVAMNDAVGGVDVVSPETIENFAEGESYHLEGNDAERFVRARRHDIVDANLLRMERQKTYATSYINKIIEETKQDITTPVDIFNASSPYSCTNLNPSKISYLASELVMGNGMSIEMKTVEGSLTQDEEGYALYNIDEKAFYELFLSVFYEKM